MTTLKLIAEHDPSKLEVSGVATRERKLYWRKSELTGILRFKLVNEQFQAKDDLGWEPIHEAVRSGHLNVVELFLEHNVDTNKRTLSGLSTLDIAVEFLGGSHAVTTMLIENGATSAKKDGEL